MDVVRNINVDFRILKEPRGFIRIIQFFVSILAFATICSSATAIVKVHCKPSASNATETITIKYSYPFSLGGITVKAPFCMAEQEDYTPLSSISFAPAAQFFCFVGVMSFLLCIGYCVAYVVFSPVFANGSRGAMIDFIFSAVWTVLWLIASSAWADKLSLMGKFLAPGMIINQDLHGNDFCGNPNVKSCEAGDAGSHATLVASVMFGFLNMAIWGVGLWFLFKDTHWHKEVSGDRENFDQPQAEAGGAGGSAPYSASDPSKEPTY